MGKKCIHIIWIILLDICLIGAALCVFALFHHVIPKEGEQNGYVVTMPQEGTDQEEILENPAEIVPSPDNLIPVVQEDEVQEEVPEHQVEALDTPKELTWKEKFAHYFSENDVISTETQYRDANVSVTYYEGEKDGSRYCVENIYISDIKYFRTAFADDTYGRGITQWPLEMAIENSAVAAVNGDYYGATNSSLVIRNGVLYSDQMRDNICVMFADGSMAAYEVDQVDLDKLIEQGVWQAWSFGPSLLDERGHAKEAFSSNVKAANPRTAVGYYEPGHYCFVTVDGRNQDSEGLTLAQLSGLMEELGCSFAYNLDGGKTSFMVFQDSVMNVPVDGGRRSSDILYIQRSEQP